MVLTTASDDQAMAVIEFFRGTGTEMKAPVAIGSVKIGDLSSRFHDIELVLEEREDGSIEAKANVVGSTRIEQVRLDPDAEGPIDSLEGRDDREILEDDSLLADGVDDFDLEGPAASLGDSVAVDPSLSEEDEHLTLDDLDTDLAGLDTADGESELEAGGADVFTAVEDSAAEDSEDAASDLSLDALDFGAETTPGDELSDYQSFDQEPPGAEGFEDENPTDMPAGGGTIDDFSLDDLDATLEEPASSSDSGQSQDDFGSNMDFDLGGDSSVDEEADSTLELSGGPDVGGSDALDDLSEGSLGADEEAGFGATSLNDDFNFEDRSEGMDDLGMDDFGSSDFGEGASEDTLSHHALSEEASPTPEETEDSATLASAEPGKDKRSQETRAKEKRTKEKKKKEPKKEAPRPVTPTKKSDKPDHLALVLGLIVFIPLALMLITLVILNMIRPVYRPPLGFQSGGTPALVQTARWPSHGSSSSIHSTDAC